jgi:hypothetical protein
MTAPYDVERALRDGLALSDGAEPVYPARRWLLRMLWPVLLALLVAVAIVAVRLNLLG